MKTESFPSVNVEDRKKGSKASHFQLNKSMKRNKQDRKLLHRLWSLQSTEMSDFNVISLLWISWKTDEEMEKVVCDRQKKLGEKAD